MGTLAAAFAIALTAVVSYVTWLGLQHHRLRQRLEALETAVGDEKTRRPRSRAA